MRYILTFHRPPGYLPASSLPGLVKPVYLGPIEFQATVHTRERTAREQVDTLCASTGLQVRAVQKGSR